MTEPDSLEALVSKVAWASSSLEACAELGNLSSIIAQNHLLVPAQQLQRVRHCLHADHTIWSPQVAQFLDNLDAQCRELVTTLKTDLEMSRGAAQQATLTAEGLEAQLFKHRSALKTAAEQVRILKSELSIAEEGPEKMKSIEAGYAAQAQEMEQHLAQRGYLSDSNAQAGAEFNNSEITRKRVLSDVLTIGSSACSPAKMFKQDPEALMQEAMLLDHDQLRERVLTELAADQQHPVARSRCIQSGWGGMQRDPSEAFRLFSLLETVREHSKAAQCCMAECYLHGLGVPADPEMAFVWYTASAQAGLARAQCSLGMCYRAGIGTEPDRTRACEWFIAATRQDHAHAHVRLGILLQSVQQNQSAFECFSKAAGLGHSFAECWIGQAFHKGLAGVVAVDKARAAEWFAKAAVQGDAHAQCSLGEYHRYGVAGSINKQKAAHWFSKAARQGHARALYHMTAARQAKDLQDARPTSATPVPTAVASATRTTSAIKCQKTLVLNLEPEVQPRVQPQAKSMAEEFATRLSNLQKSSIMKRSVAKQGTKPRAVEGLEATVSSPATAREPTITSATHTHYKSANNCHTLVREPNPEVPPRAKSMAEEFASRLSNLQKLQKKQKDLQEQVYTNSISPR